LTVRVFVAATLAEWLPTKVLEFSMLESSERPVRVSAIASFNNRIPVPRDSHNRPRTPFSFQRFLIPEICGFEGRAIYLDADMQVFADIDALWSAPMDGHDLLAVSEGTAGRKGQFSVMVLDCERLRWRIADVVRGLDEGRYTYEQLMYEMCVAASVGRTLDPAWNSLENYVPGSTRLLHYTDMNTQPWVTTENRLGQLWTACLKRAITAGFVTLDDLAREIAQGHVRPSLMPEMRGITLSAEQMRAADAEFVAPYKSIGGGKADWGASVPGRLWAYTRRRLGRLRALAQR
jgi:hypothetical protein